MAQQQHSYPRLERGLVQALTTDPQLSALIEGRVYRIPAPPTAPIPFVGFSYLSGGLVQTSPRPSLDVNYRVEYAAEEMYIAEEGLALVFDALVYTPLTIEGWHNYDTDAGGKFVAIDMNRAEPIYMVGMFFRFRADLLD